MKLQKVTLKNFRGVRESTSITLNNGQSLLLYGDNGTGKSSFADALEWFILDSVSHLNGEEIEKYGGLRNALSGPSEECFVELEVLPKKVGKKLLNYQKDKLKPQLDTAATELVSLLQKELLLIRNRNMVSFILATKTERLLEISNIIGFEEVLKAKDVFRKAANALKSLLKARGFNEHLAAKQGIMLQKLQATISNKEHFYAAINSQLQPFDIGFLVNDKESLIKAIELLKGSIDEKELKLRNSLERANVGIIETIKSFSSFDKELLSLTNEIKTLQSDKNNIEQITLSKLLDEAEKILKIHVKDECPLCQQNISHDTLLALIGTRISSLKKTKDKLREIEASKDTLLTSLREIYQSLNSHVKSLQNNAITGIDFQKCLETLSSIQTLGNELKKEPINIDITKIEFQFSSQNSFQELQNKIDEVIKGKKSDNSSKVIDILSGISVAEVAFEEFEKLEKEKSIIEAQKATLEDILSNFISIQREEMKSFLESISSNVNEYFLFMNNEEKVDKIELSTIDDSDGEFAGIAIQLKFHGQAIASPKKYLSESYLNCIGLCIFLASAKLFNKKSKFLILDDVISSFDKKHRMRFGQLLTEKFSDYQLLVLTHESEWFNFMSSMVKGIGWKISRTSWSTDKGTSLEVPAGEIKEQIEEKLKSNNEQGLGNLLRKYLERMLKEVCLELEAEVKFQFNDRNEQRMTEELLSSVKSRLKAKSDIYDADAIKRLSSSKFIANPTSHDSQYNDSIDDLKVFYKDICDFEALFRCNELKCKRKVSTQNINKVKNTISCKCGAKEIAWKS